MLRRITPALALFLAACATQPESAPPSSVAPPSTPRETEHEHGRLIGLDVPELGKLLGAPQFQVREGSGLKLQYRGGGCVLDAYLYRDVDGRGVERVTHVDARLPSGVDTNVAGCEAAIEASH